MHARNSAAGDQHMRHTDRTCCISRGASGYKNFIRNSLCKDTTHQNFNQYNLIELKWNLNWHFQPFFFWIMNRLDEFHVYIIASHYISLNNAYSEFLNI